MVKVTKIKKHNKCKNESSYTFVEIEEGGRTATLFMALCVPTKEGDNVTFSIMENKPESCIEGLKPSDFHVVLGDRRGDSNDPEWDNNPTLDKVLLAEEANKKAYENGELTSPFIILASAIRGFDIDELEDVF